MKPAQPVIHILLNPLLWNLSFLCLPAVTHLFLYSSPQPTSVKHFLLQTLPPSSHSQSDGRFTVSRHRPVLGPAELLSSQPLSNILVTKFREPRAQLLLRPLVQHLPSEAPLLLLALEMTSSVVSSFLSSTSLPFCLFCLPPRQNLFFLTLWDNSLDPGSSFALLFFVIL